jgi:(S)-2-hydroxy-acid oxidase
MLNENSIHLSPRVLRDVSSIDTKTSIFGFEYSLPVGIAPSAMQRLASKLGELDTARAATKLNLNMTLSSQSTTALEDVKSFRESLTLSNQPLPPLWFQLYLTQDIEKSLSLINRAERK